MSVSNESPLPPLHPGGRKRNSRPVTDHEWKAIRMRYESTDISQRRLAQELGISYSTMSHRAMREKWSQGAALVLAARENLMEKTSVALETATSQAADLAAKQLIDELQPWINQQKAEQIKRAIKRSTKAQERLDLISEGYQATTKDGELVDLPIGPKEESFLAQAEDKYDNIIRRNLGMNELNGVSGSLSIQVLTNQAAIAVSQS